MPALAFLAVVGLVLVSLVACDRYGLPKVSRLLVRWNCVVVRRSYYALGFLQYRMAWHLNRRAPRKDRHSV
jgi:hypothetical protein